MRLLRAFWSRLKAPLFAECQESDLASELNLHLQMLTDDNVRAGHAPGEAHRRARIALGGIEALRADCRDASLARQPFLLLLFGMFAGLALLLACIGIYGVLAYLTSQRVPEVGVRMALGASARDLVQLVLRQSVAMIFGVVVVGVAGALAAGRLLDRLVSGMQSAEPVTFAAMVSILVAAALFAGFVPARGASRVDPMRALRQE